MTSEFITLARVLKTQGRHGEVAVEVQSDVPDRFREGMHLWSLAEDGSRRELEIEDLWPHKGQLILKFVEIDSISKAEELAGCELGNIGEVRFGAGEAPLLVVKAGSKEYEIPYAEAYLQQVDLSHKQIRMSLPEGLLEVNAPLTAEEKLAQRAPLRTKTK